MNMKLHEALWDLPLSVGHQLCHSIAIANGAETIRPEADVMAEFAAIKRAVSRPAEAA